MEIFDKILAIFYSMVILLNAVCLRRMVGTWLFPGCIFSLFWFFYTFFPLVVLFEVPVNSNAIAFITLAVLLFSSSFLLFDWEKAFEDNLSKPAAKTVYQTNFLKLVLIFSVIISIIGSFIHLFAQGFGLSDLIANPIGVASKFANARYEDNLTYSIFGPISLLFSNLAVIIGGLIFGAAEGKKPKKILLAFIPSIIILLTQSSKGLFFQSVFLFLGGMFITKLYANDFKIFSLKGLGKLAIVSLFLIILLAVSFLSRGLQDIDDVGVLLSNLRILFATYFFGHIYGFSDWFTAYTGGLAAFNYDVSNYYFGFYTFTVIFEMFGSTKVTPAGVFEEYFVYKDLLDSNIYTIFRGMIMDFGLVGALVFMLVNGFVLHGIYYLFIRRNWPIIPVVILLFMLEYIHMSFIISLLTWAIIPLTFIACYLILKFNHYRFVLKSTTEE
jgi:oligosaccharide repeat unit polymerase